MKIKLKKLEVQTRKDQELVETLVKYGMDRDEQALKTLGNRMAANMVLLGAVVKTAGLVSEEALLQSLAKRVPSSFLETNRKALEAGVDILDTAMGPFSGGTSQPPTESVVAALQGTEFDTGLDLELLVEIPGNSKKPDLVKIIITPGRFCLIAKSHKKRYIFITSRNRLSHNNP
jgi:hypothetical protein